MNKYVIMGYAFIVLFFAVGVDFDHIPLWIFEIRFNWYFPNILFQVAYEGRNLHTIYIFAIDGIILSAICTAFVVRFNKPDSILEIVKDDN
jgi:D-alanyl-lipoteichoic acid acyltransferase DltB (MBOAT superfamily)